MGDSTWANAAALTDVVATTYIKRHLNNYGTQMYGFLFTQLTEIRVALISQQSPERSVCPRAG
jgi:hypothetical protein